MSRKYDQYARRSRSSERSRASPLRRGPQSASQGRTLEPAPQLAPTPPIQQLPGGTKQATTESSSRTMMSATVTLLPSGRIVTLDPFSADTPVSALKQMAGRKAGVEILDHRFLMNGIPLENGALSLLSYGAKTRKAALVLLQRKLPSRIEVTVTLPAALQENTDMSSTVNELSPEKTLDVWVAPGGDVEVLKAALEAKGIHYNHEEFYLAYAGAPLQANQDLYSQGLRPQATLDLVPRVLSVELQTRKGPIELDLWSSDTVLELRQKLAAHAETGAASSAAIAASHTRGQFAVLWRGSVLDEGPRRLSMRKLGISNGDVLHLQPLPVPIPLKLPPRSEADQGTVVMVPVDPDRGTAFDVKLALIADFGVPSQDAPRARSATSASSSSASHSAALFWLERCISTPLSAVCLEDSTAPLPSDIIAHALALQRSHVSKAPSEALMCVGWAKLELSVETPVGRTVKVSVGALEPASALSRAVYRATGVPVDDQCLLVKPTTSNSSGLVSSELVEVLGSDHDDDFPRSYDGSGNGNVHSPMQPWVACLPGLRDGERHLVLNYKPDPGDLTMNTMPSATTTAVTTTADTESASNRSRTTSPLSPYLCHQPVLPCHPVLSELHNLGGCPGPNPRAWHFNPGFGAHLWLFGDPSFGAVSNNGSNSSASGSSHSSAASPGVAKPPCMFQCHGEACGGAHGLTTAELDQVLKAWGLMGFSRFLAIFATQWPGARPATSPYHREHPTLDKVLGTFLFVAGVCAKHNLGFEEAQRVRFAPPDESQHTVSSSFSSSSSSSPNGLSTSGSRALSVSQSTDSTLESRLNLVGGSAEKRGAAGGLPCGAAKAAQAQAWRDACASVRADERLGERVASRLDVLAKERVVAAEAAFNKASQLVPYEYANDTTKPVLEGANHAKIAMDSSAAVNLANGSPDSGGLHHHLSVDRLTPPRVLRNSEIPLNLVDNRSSPNRPASLEDISMANGVSGQVRGGSLTRRHHDAAVNGEEHLLKGDLSADADTPQNLQLESSSMRGKSSSPFSLPAIDRGTPPPTSEDRSQHQNDDSDNYSNENSRSSPRGRAMERPSVPGESIRSTTGGTVASLGHALWGNQNGSKHNSPPQPPNEAYKAATIAAAEEEASVFDGDAAAVGAVKVNAGVSVSARAEAEAAATELAKLRSEQLELTAAREALEKQIAMRREAHALREANETLALEVASLQRSAHGKMESPAQRNEGKEAGSSGQGSPGSAISRQRMSRQSTEPSLRRPQESRDKWYSSAENKVDDFGDNSGAINQRRFSKSPDRAGYMAPSAEWVMASNDTQQPHTMPARYHHSPPLPENEVLNSDPYTTNSSVRLERPRLSGRDSGGARYRVDEDTKHANPQFDPRTRESRSRNSVHSQSESRLPRSSAWMEHQQRGSGSGSDDLRREDENDSIRQRDSTSDVGVPNYSREPSQSLSRVDENFNFSGGPTVHNEGSDRVRGRRSASLSRHAPMNEDPLEAWARSSFERAQPTRRSTSLVARYMAQRSEERHSLRGTSEGGLGRKQHFRSQFSFEDEPPPRSECSVSDVDSEVYQVSVHSRSRSEVQRGSRAVRGHKEDGSNEPRIGRGQRTQRAKPSPHEMNGRCYAVEDDDAMGRSRDPGDDSGLSPREAEDFQDRHLRTSVFSERECSRRSVPLSRDELEKMHRNAESYDNRWFDENDTDDHADTLTETKSDLGSRSRLEFSEGYTREEGQAKKRRQTKEDVRDDENIAGAKRGAAGPELNQYYRGQLTGQQQMRQVEAELRKQEMAAKVFTVDDLKDAMAKYLRKTVYMKPEVLFNSMRTNKRVSFIGAPELAVAFQKYTSIGVAPDDPALLQVVSELSPTGKLKFTSADLKANWHVLKGGSEKPKHNAAPAASAPALAKAEVEPALSWKDAAKAGLPQRTSNSKPQKRKSREKESKESLRNEVESSTPQNYEDNLQHEFESRSEVKSEEEFNSSIGESESEIKLSSKAKRPSDKSTTPSYRKGDHVEINVGDEDGEEWLPALVERGVIQDGGIAVCMLQGYDDDDARFDVDLEYVRALTHHHEEALKLIDVQMMQKGVKVSAWNCRGSEFLDATVLKVSGNATVTLRYDDFAEDVMVPWAYLRSSKNLLEPLQDSLKDCVVKDTGTPSSVVDVFVSNDQDNLYEAEEAKTTSRDTAEDDDAEDSTEGEARESHSETADDVNLESELSQMIAGEDPSTSADDVWTSMREYLINQGSARFFELFESVDRNCSGFVDTEAFTLVLEDMGIEDLSTDAVNELMQSIDSQEDERVNYGELLRTLQSAQLKTSGENDSEPVEEEATRTGDDNKIDALPKAALDEDLTLEAEKLWDSIRAYAGMHGHSVLLQIFRDSNRDHNKPYSADDFIDALTKMSLEEFNLATVKSAIRMANPSRIETLEYSELLYALRSKVEVEATSKIETDAARKVEERLDAKSELFKLMESVGLEDHHDKLCAAAEGTTVAAMYSFGKSKMIGLGMPRIKVAKLWRQIESNSPADSEEAEGMALGIVQPINSSKSIPMLYKVGEYVEVSVTYDGEEDVGAWLPAIVERLPVDSDAEYHVRLLTGPDEDASYLDVSESFLRTIPDRDGEVPSSVIDFQRVNAWYCHEAKFHEATVLSSTQNGTVIVNFFSFELEQEVPLAYVRIDPDFEIPSSAHHVNECVEVSVTYEGEDEEAWLPALIEVAPDGEKQDYDLQLLGDPGEESSRLSVDPSFVRPISVDDGISLAAESLSEGNEVSAWLAHENRFCNGRILSISSQSLDSFVVVDFTEFELKQEVPIKYLRNLSEEEKEVGVDVVLSTKTHEIEPKEEENCEEILLHEEIVQASTFVTSICVGDCVEVSVTYEGEDEEVWLPALVEAIPSGDTSDFSVRLLGDPSENERSRLDVDSVFIRPTTVQEGALLSDVAIEQRVSAWHTNENQFCDAQVLELSGTYAVVKFLKSELQQEVPLKCLRSPEVHDNASEKQSNDDEMDDEDDLQAELAKMAGHDNDDDDEEDDNEGNSSVAEGDGEGVALDGSDELQDLLQALQPTEEGVLNSEKEHEEAIDDNVYEVLDDDVEDAKVAEAENANLNFDDGVAEIAQGAEVDLTDGLSASPLFKVGDCIEVSVTYEGEDDEAWLPAIVESVPSRHGNPSASDDFCVRLLGDPAEESSQLNVDIAFMRNIPPERYLVEPGAMDSNSRSIKGVDLMAEKGALQPGQNVEAWYVHEDSYFSAVIVGALPDRSFAVVSFVDFELQQEVPKLCIRPAKGTANERTGSDTNDMDPGDSEILQAEPPSVFEVGGFVEVSISYEGEDTEVWLPAIIEAVPEEKDKRDGGQAQDQDNASLYKVRLLGDPSEPSTSLDVDLQFLRCLPLDREGLPLLEAQPFDYVTCWYGHEGGFYNATVLSVDLLQNTAVVNFTEFELEQEVPMPYLRAKDLNPISETEETEEAEEEAFRQGSLARTESLARSEGSSSISARVILPGGSEERGRSRDRVEVRAVAELAGEEEVKKKNGDTAADNGMDELSALMDEALNGDVSEEEDDDKVEGLTDRLSSNGASAPKQNIRKSASSRAVKPPPKQSQLEKKSPAPPSPPELESFGQSASAPSAEGAEAPCKVIFDATLSEHTPDSFDASAQTSFVLATADALNVTEQAVRVNASSSIDNSIAVASTAVVVATEEDAAALISHVIDPSVLAAAIERAGLGTCTISAPVTIKPPGASSSSSSENAMSTPLTPSASASEDCNDNEALNGLTPEEIAHATSLFRAAAAQPSNSHSGDTEVAPSIRLGPFKKLMLQLCKDANKALVRKKQPPLPMPKDKDLGAAFAQADVDKSGQVDEAEFLALYALAHAGQVRGLGSKSLFGSMFKSKAEMAARATAQASKTAALKAALEASHANSPTSRSRSASFDTANKNNVDGDTGPEATAASGKVTNDLTALSSSPLSSFQVEALQELFLVGGPALPKSGMLSSSSTTSSGNTEANLRLSKKDFAVLAKALTKKVAMASLASGSSSSSSSNSNGSYGSVSQGLIVSPKDKDIASWFASADRSKRGSLNCEDWVQWGQLCAQELKRPTTTAQQAAAAGKDAATAAAATGAAATGAASLRTAAAWLLGCLPPDPRSNDSMEAAAARADAALTPPAAHVPNGAYHGTSSSSTGSSNPRSAISGDGGLLPGRAALFRYLDPLQRRGVLKALTYHSALRRAQRVACLPYMRDRANVLGGLPTAEAAAVLVELRLHGDFADYLLAMGKGGGAAVRAELTSSKLKGMLAPAILFPSARTANLLFDSNKTSPRASSSNKGANGVTTAAPQSLARTLTDSSSLDELATVCQTLPGTLAAALVLEMHVRAERSHENDSHRSNAQSSSSAVDGNSGAFGVGAGPLLDLLASSAAAAAAAVLASLPADELPQIFESMSIESRAAATRFLPNQDGSRQPTSATTAAAGGEETATRAVIPPEMPQRPNRNGNASSEEMGRKMSNAAAGRIVSAVQGSAPDDSNNSNSSSSSASTATTKTPKLPPRRPRKLPPPPSVDLVEVDDEGNPGPDIESWQPACVNAKPPPTASSSSDELDLDDEPTTVVDPLCPNTVAESGVPGVYLVTPLGQLGASATASNEPPPEQLSVEASNLRPLRGDFPGDALTMPEVVAGSKVLCYYAHADALAPAECVQDEDQSRATVHVTFDDWELELEAPVAYLRKRSELQDHANKNEDGEVEPTTNELEGNETVGEIEVPEEEGEREEEGGDGGDDDDDDDDGDAMALLSSMAAQSFSEENADENAENADDMDLDLDDESGATAGESTTENTEELKQLMEGAKVDLALLDAVAKACGGASSARVAAAGEKAIVAAGVPSIRARKLHRAAIALVVNAKA